MKKHTFYAFLFIVLHLTSHAQRNDSNNFAIDGKLQGDYSDKIFLNYRLGNNELKEDSVKVENGLFQFKGYLKKPTQGWLNLRKASTILFVYLDTCKFKLKANFKKVDNYGTMVNFISLDTITGSKAYLIQKKYSSLYSQNKFKKNFKSLLFKGVSEIFKKNPNHPVVGKILSQLAYSEQIFNVAELEELYSLINVLEQNKTDLKRFHTAIQSLKNYSLGDKFINIELPDSKGDIFDLKNYKGKIVLIDFWASWCKPCRANHPKLVELYSKHQKNNFEILSISIDKEEKPWIKAIEEDNISWKNVIDKQSSTIESLGIQAIPFNYLLDKNGNILGVNLKHKDIEKLLLNQKF